ncbi:MAG TPA: flagellum-specific ATP synthase FliI, partial [Acetobacteraceae bacterium]|nr:flagellum-specific ATP synthase FliI [Acetobacteraceae bacterium]
MRQFDACTRLTHAAAAVGGAGGYDRMAPIGCLEGRVAAVSGLAVEVTGLSRQVAIGDRIRLAGRAGQDVAAEIVGFRGGVCQAMAYGAAEGLGPGGPVYADLPPAPGALAVADDWVGRVIDPLGRSLDGKGALPRGPVARPVRAAPPAATVRARLGPRIDLGVRALNLFATCRQGQRLGLFAGSGVGKSTLLAMLARQTGCDVAVLALVGERGREVREFLEDDLGAEGLARSVVV